MNIETNKYNPIIPKQLEDYTNIKNIILIDTDVQDYMSFYDYANNITLPIIYSSQSNREDLKNFVRLNFTKIERIGIVCNDGSINNKPFMNGELFYTEDDLMEGQNNYTDNLRFIIDILNEFQVSNIDYLACSSLNISNWMKYYEIIGNNTNTIVGASDDNTGNILYGGDWVMESTGDSIELIYWTSEMNKYSETLAVSVISTSTIVTNANLNNGSIYTWPITIDGGTVTTPTIITFGDDITLNSTSKYFIINSGYVTFEGNGKTVTIDGVTNYPGLIRNGTVGSNGFSNITVKNIGLETLNSSTINTSNGWIAQAYWSNGSNNNIITSCYTTGNITTYNSGGIAGRNFTGSVENCYTTGQIAYDYAGGIVGGGTLVTGTIANCYSTGAISGYYAGGILGGSASGYPTITNCYTRGIISGDYAGGIAGNYSMVVITNCYTIGQTIGVNSSTICSSFSATITNSFGSNTGIWSDSVALNYLTGNPTYLNSVLTNPVGTTWMDINSGNSTTPWIFSNFSCSPYSSNSETSYSQTIVKSNATISALNPSGWSFAMISINSILPSSFPTITITSINNVTGGKISTTNVTDTTIYTIKIYSVSGSKYTATDFILTVQNGITTITTSITFTNNIVSNYEWPVTINSANLPITITFGDDITIDTFSKYFIINSSNITINGNGQLVKINNVIDYPGLFQNGTLNSDGYSNTIIKNIGIQSLNSSTLSATNGWIGQIYWAKNTSGCIINTCYSTGNLTNSQCGGICGNYSYGTIINCYSTGTIGISTKSSGICSDNCNCTIANCFSTGTIGSYCGGICGIGTSSCSVTNCYTTGSIGDYAGGICRGDYNTIDMPFTVTNCYTNGTISGIYAGGICGSYVTSLNIINCYTTGNINGVSSGGICGDSCVINITNCYTIGIPNGSGSGRLAPINSNVSLVNSGSSSVAGVWDDTTAAQFLTGTPTPSNPVGTVWINTNTATATDYWLFSTFGNSPYSTNNSNTFTQTILQGGTTYPALNPAGHNFSILSINSQIPSNYPTITIVQSDPVLGGQIIVGLTTPVATYSIKILQQSDYTITNFDLQINLFCYLETTKILCFIDGCEQWIPIKDIKNDTLVKTYLHGYKKVLKKGIMTLQNTPSNSIHKLYKLDKSLKSFYPNIFEDLYVSGQHSILVDNLTKTQMNKTLSKWKYLQKIDDKFLLMSWVNEHFQQVNDSNFYTLYQLVLECDNPKTQYGIYANGIPSESMSPHTFKKKKIITA